MNSRVFSTAATFCGSSTTQIDVAVALVAAAERARIGVGDVVADRAVGDALLHLANGVDQPIGLLARRLQDVEREALRALRADAGQALQLLDEAQERIGEGHHG